MFKNGQFLLFERNLKKKFALQICRLLASSIMPSSVHFCNTSNTYLLTKLDMHPSIIFQAHVSNAIRTHFIRKTTSQNQPLIPEAKKISTPG